MNFFKSNSERELWIDLNAKRQIEWEKSLTYFNKETGKNEPTNQALNPRSMEDALIISRIQLEYDERNNDLRYSLDQLLTLNVEELKEISHNRFKDKVSKFL
jgi:hypothetical protein